MADSEECSTVVEWLVADWLNHATGLTDCQAHLTVPSPRPERFITVERTGQARSLTQERSTLTVKVYAPTLWEAALLTDEYVVPRLESMPSGVTDVAAVDVLSVFNNPDPGPPPAQRRQVNIQVIRPAR